MKMIDQMKRVKVKPETGKLMVKISDVDHFWMVTRPRRFGNKGLKWSKGVGCRS